MIAAASMDRVETEDEAEGRRLAQALGAACLDRGWSLVTAESCTGGGVAELITRIPGSSAWYECGFVVYQNRAKEQLLKVPGALLQRYGAVSEQTAQAMAQGALERSPAGLAVAVTGIAGPDGGSAQKPVGTVCLAWWARAAPRAGRTVTARFSGDRQAVRGQACLLALRGLLELLHRCASAPDGQ